MVEDKGQAGTDIEVTEEMIEAALSVIVSERAYDSERADCGARDVVRMMLFASEQCRPISVEGPKRRQQPRQIVPQLPAILRWFRKGFPFLLREPEL